MIQYIKTTYDKLLPSMFIPVLLVLTNFVKGTICQYICMDKPKMACNGLEYSQLSRVINYDNEY